MAADTAFATLCGFIRVVAALSKYITVRNPAFAAIYRLSQVKACRFQMPQRFRRIALPQLYSVGAADAGAGRHSDYDAAKLASFQ
jgi:hypothetical protein